MRKLTAKERRFVTELNVDQNGTKAAERAGYSVRSARQIAARLLSKDYIQAAQEKKIAKVEERTEIDAARIEDGLLAIAEADVRKAFNSDGTPKPITELPDDVAKAIVGVETDGDGNVLRYKFADKIRPLELLGKRKKLFTDVHEHTGKDGKPLVPAFDFSSFSMPELKRLANLKNGAGDSAH